MSLDHRIYIGAFDEQALQRGVLVVSRPVGWGRFVTLFRDHGGGVSSTTAEVSGHTFTFHDHGFLSCSAVIGRQDVVDFIFLLATETVCRIASLESYSDQSPEEFRSDYEVILNPGKFRSRKSQ